MLENLSLLKKWMIVLAIPLLFQFVFLGILFKLQADRAYAQKWAIHSKDVIAQAETLSRLLVDARSEILSQIVVDAGSGVDFATISDRVFERIVAIRNRVKDNASQQAIVEEIAELAKAYLDRLNKTDQSLRAGKKDEAIAGLGDPFRLQKIREIRALIATFLANEQRLDDDRQAILSRASQWQTAMIYFGGIVSIAIAAALVQVFSRGLANRIAGLAENAKRLAEGQALDATIKGNDEIGRLAVVFDAMAKSLTERELENEMFVYSVSHDLRSPLVNLQGFSRELAYTADDLRHAVAPLAKSPEVESRLARLLDTDMADSIRFIQKAVMSLSAIIDSLLRLSRAGRVEYRMQPLDMNEIVGHVVQAMRITTAEKGAVIVVAADLPSARGDPTIVEQVFSNLLSNAVKYLDPDRPGRIEVGCLSSTDDTTGLQTYYVKDNGLGIASAHQTKLFLAFQRLHPGVAKGEGIGLALVRRMVERHGGRIWVESEVGLGSTFFLTLPAGLP